MEAGGQEEDRAVGAAGDGGPMGHQVEVLVALAEHEEQAHQKRDDIPAAQPEDVAALGREQPSKEHQLTGKPDYGANTDHVGPIERMNSRRDRSTRGPYSARHIRKYD